MHLIATSAIIIATGILAILLCSVLAGMTLSSRAPAHYQSENAKDAVKLSIGIISTLSALVIGLLVASAKDSYEARNNQVKQITANVLLLDFILSQYGTDATYARQGLRLSIGEIVNRIWNEDDLGKQSRAPIPAASAEAFFRTLHELVPREEHLRPLQTRAIQIATEIGQSRTLLFAQSRDRIPLPFLGILIFWLAGIFFGIGFLTRASVTGAVALLICAISVSGAIFLILELNRPFTGLMQIPSIPLREALAPLG